MQQKTHEKPHSPYIYKPISHSKNLLHRIESHSSREISQEFWDGLEKEIQKRGISKKEIRAEDVRNILKKMQESE